MKKVYLFLPLIFLTIPPLSWGQGMVIKDAIGGAEIPKNFPTDLEGTIGPKKVRLHIVPNGSAADCKLSFESGDMNLFALEKAKKTFFTRKLQIIFYQSYPGVEHCLDHKFVLEGSLAKDGTYSGSYQELPNGEKGNFSLKRGSPDPFSGNYDSPDDYMFIQLAGADSLNFSLGNDWCGISGSAKIAGKTAHFEKMMKGVLVHLNFDFSQPGKCIVESNINSPEAQEQGIKELLGNVMNCEPNFSGEYQLHWEGATLQENKDRKALQASAPTETPIPADSDENQYCTDMSAEVKSKRLDGVEGVTFTSPGSNSVVFVYKDKHGPTDHGATGGQCGVRLETYKQNAGGVLTKTGRWEDLNQGYNDRLIVGEPIPVCPDYLLLETETDSDDLSNSDHHRYVFDGNAKIVGQDTYMGWDEDAWVEKDGKYILWDITWDHIGVKTPDFKDIWTVKEKTVHGTSFYSPNLRYASREYGKDGETLAVYGLDGSSPGRFELPFSMKDFRDEEVLGLTNDLGVWFRDQNNIYLLDLKGGKVLKMILPNYPNRKLWSYQGSDDIFNVFREFEYESTTDQIKDNPRPKIKLDLVHGTTEVSLDGKTWQPIDLKPKDSNARK